ncbi:UNVERIFIED_CONTAM: hypothetical protein FKN15_049418 [Acipenser sinensis]
MRRQTPLTTGNRGGYGAFGPALGRQQTDTKITPSSQGRTPNVLLHKPPAAGDRSDKRLTLPPRFQRDFQVHLSRNTQQSNVNLNESLSPVSPSTPPPSSYNVQLVQTRLKEILRKFSNGIWVSKLPQLYRKLYNQELPADAMKELEHWTQICTVEKPCTSGLLELLLYPAKTHAQTKAALSQDRTSPVFEKPGSPTHTLPPVTSKPRVPPEIKLKVAELLVKYSSGLWASALPKLFQDVYKLKFPEFILDDPSLLSDVCTADYPMPDNTKKAILYAKVTEDENQNKVTLKVTETALQRLSNLTVPPLVIPNEEYPSVLLVAARAEEEDEFLRAKICEVTGDKVKPFCGKCCVARYKGKWSRVEITNLHGSRVVDILFIDIGLPSSVEVVELREIPPPYLQELLSVPPQAIKCCLADLPVSVGSWTPDAVLWLRDAVLNCSDCSMKIVKWDEAKRQGHIYLFTSKNFYDHESSINFQIADSDLWKHQKDVFLSSSSVSPRKESSPISQPKTAVPEAGDCQIAEISQLPPLLALPQPGQNLDIYVSVACHPGYFVLQPWQDLYKLEVLMGEMILYYNKMDGKPIHIEKNQIYAAKVENNWHRVLVKGKLINGLVSVYQLDYGRHELVNCTKVQPLIEEFRQLPFQGVTAQLAGVKQKQWSEEASIVFRNHVEKKPLVAQLDTVHESTHPWERKVVVYLVDTSHEEADIWIHDIMYEFIEELSKAA